MKTLVIDIETSPAVMRGFGLFDQNFGLNQVVDPGGVICFAAKWVGSKKVHFHSEYDAGGRAGVAEASWELYDEADYVVHFNGTSFDTKHLQREMLLAGMGPPSPHKPIDLMRISKANFRWLSNKLQHVSEQLGVGSKLKHEGFDLWNGWMDGDPGAIKRMTRYCKQDVALTEELFLALEPWIPKTARTNMAIGQIGTVCPGCGSRNLKLFGVYRTAVSSYQRYRCNDCMRVSRGGPRLEKANLTALS